MNTTINPPARNKLWWLYGIYVIAMFVWGTYSMVFTPSPYPWLTCMSIAFDAVGLVCFYCFLVQMPAISRGFWMGFVSLYFLKLIFALGIIVHNAMRFAWDGSRESYVTLMSFVGVLLGVPMLIAFARYAFGSRQMWAMFAPAQARGRSGNQVERDATAESID